LETDVILGWSLTACLAVFGLIVWIVCWTKGRKSEHLCNFRHNHAGLRVVDHLVVEEMFEKPFLRIKFRCESCKLTYTRCSGTLTSREEKLWKRYIGILDGMVTG
jgi:hypothetical protein